MADGGIPDKKTGKSVMRGMINTISTLLQRRSWTGAAGLSFEGARDLYAVFGYPTTLTAENFMEKYTRNGIAKRVVEFPVDATWSDPPMITGSARFIKAWNDLATRQKVFFMFRRLDVLVGLGQYAVLLVGYDDGRPLNQPVNSSKKNAVIYLQPYSEGFVSITKYEENTHSPRFGLPTMYELQPGEVRKKNNNINPSLIRDTIEVHHSRILHVAENTTDNPIIGHSRLEAVFNYLNDLEKIAGGSAEAYWMTANRGMQIDIDKEMDLDDDDQEQMEQEIQDYQHQLRRFMRTRGTKITPLGADPTDPSGTFDVSINLISGTTGIPQRILLGAEAGQLASEQDRANWANRVQERVSNYAGPIVLLPFIEMQIRNGALPVPSTMTVEWPDAFKLSPLERGQASAQMARSAANIIKVMTTPIADDGSGMAEVTESEEMENSTPESTDPETGEVTPGTSSTTLVDRKTVKPSHTLLTDEEARQIIGFGKHAPVLDDAQDSDPSKKPSPEGRGNIRAMKSMLEAMTGRKPMWSMTLTFPDAKDE